MRIAIVLLSGMYPDVIGGAEIFSYRLAKELAKQGHEVHIIAKKGEQFRTEFKNGVFLRAYSDTGIPGLKMLLRLFQAFQNLIMVQPTVVLGIMFSSAFVCKIYSSICGSPFAIRFAGDDFRILFSEMYDDKSKIAYQGAGNTLKLLYPNILKILRKNSSFVAINKEMFDNLILLGVAQKHIRLIYNFIDNSFFDIVPKAEKPTVVFCGRIVPKKRVDILVRAFVKIVSDIPTARLVIVGGGTHKTNIEKLVDDLGIASNVDIMGFVPYNEVKTYFSRASVFVLPSEYEGTPNTLLQAMAAGLPIVATKVSGIPDVIKDEVCGLLVPPNNIDTLANAISLLLLDKDKAKKLGINARKRALDFKIENIVAKYDSLFNKMLQL